MRHTALKLKLFAGKPLLVLLVLTPILLFGVAGKYFLNNTANAVTNSTINFQARLMTNTGAIAADGDYNVEFKLYDALTSTGSSQGSCTGDTHCLWTETRTSSNVIHVANGYISANLGSVTGFPTTINWDQQLYLTMNIGGTGTPSWDGEMSPRLKLTAVPYAFRASQLAALAGSHTGVLQFAASLAQDSQITLPDPGATGAATVCYQSSTACGFLTGTAGSYIQNTTTVQSPGNIAIRSAAIGSVGALIQGANGQTADLLDLQSYNGSTGTNVFSVGSAGVVTLNGGQTADITTAASASGSASAITLQPGTSGGASSNGAAVTIQGGDGSGTTSVTGGALTLQGGNATGASGTRNGGNVTIDGGTGATANGSVNIGGTNAPTVNIGAVGSTAKATTIHIGDTSTTTAGAIQNVTIGSNSNLAHTTIIQGGNSNTAGSEAIRIVPQTAGGIAIGSTTGTGTITLGQSTATNTINIGNANFTAASTQTINIANGTQNTAASTLTVNILSSAGGNAGVARLFLANNNRVQQVDIGNVVSAGNRTINIFTGSTSAGVTDTINIGTGNPAGSKAIHIGDGTPTGSGANTVTVGSTALTSTTTIQGGTGSGAVSIQAGASGTISVGTANANTINIGSTSTSTSAVTISGGTGATGNILLQSNNAATGVVVKSATNSSAAFVIQDSGATNTYLNVSTSGQAITVGYSGSTTTLNGTVKVATLGSVGANSAVVCRDTTTGALTSCDSGSGLPFIQGGNTFGTLAGNVATLGTLDANSLQVKTNNVVRATFDTSNNLFLGNGTTAAAPNSSTITATGSTTVGTAGGSITLQGGAGAASTTGSAGGNITLQGGTAGGTASSGGNVLIQGGTAAGSGLKGLIQLNGATYFTTTTYTSGTSATITQSAVDSFSAILATATASGLTFTVPSPSATTASGRVLYITNVGSNAFILTFASSNLSLSPGASATLVWSGSAWTGAGADAATLQTNYNNSLGGNNPEILLDSTRTGLDIQDANTSLGSTVPLLAVRASATATSLGSPLFVVENNAGAPLVGIGTATASRALDVSVNNSTVNGMPVLIEQAGSGDSGIEYKAGGKNFYEGIDGTDGVFKISSASASNGTVVQGNNNPNGTDSGDDTNSNSTQASKFVAGTTGTVSSISAYLNTATGNVQVGIYSDNGSGTGPGTLLGSSNAVTAVTGWNTLAVSGGPTITSGTTYWLALGTSGGSHFKYGPGTTGSTVYDLGGYPLPTGTGWVTNGGSSASLVDIYASVSTGVTDEFAGTPLFRLTDTGQTTLQNATDSTTAFQVLNNAGATLLGVDTSAATVSLGITGTTATAGTVNVGTSTGATQTVNIGSATSGSAANGTTVLLQGGNTASAVKIQALAGGTIGIGNNNAANTLQIGSTILSSGTQTIGIGNNNTSGGTTNITIGTGSSATGGTTILQGKTATNVTSNGAVTITAGATSTWSTTTGNINIQAGSSGGALNFTGGTASGAAAAGAVTVQGGAASATAGSSGGGVNILGGLGTATGAGGAGGTLYLSAGNAQGTGNNAGGSITLNLGSATGTGAQGTFQVQNALGANLLTVDPTNTTAGLNLAVNPGAEVTGTFTTNWTAQTGTGTPVISRDTTAAEVASGSNSVKVATTGANQGVRNNLGAALATGTSYIVSFSAKSSTAITDLSVTYYRNSTTSDVACSNYSTQTLSTTAWTKVSCTFQTTGNAGDTTAFLAITQVASATRSIFIDNLSIVAVNSSGTSNVGDLKVGGAQSQGLTLLTLDTYAGTPFTGSNSSLAGSMYFDTSQGKIQCYDGTTWGACGAAPNNIITLSPEYAGAVLHQSGSSSIGTMTSDFCSGTAGININDGTSSQPSICSSTQTFNFYRWTSPQSTAQQYSLWVTYQLPSTFKNFVNGTTTLTGRTDSTNSTVQYTIYKNVSGSALSTCSTNTSVSTGSQANWQVVAPNTDPSGCSFAAGNSIIFKIDVISSNNANAYVSNLNFAFSNQ
jgi:hypothetical protein